MLEFYVKGIRIIYLLKVKRQIGRDDEKHFEELSKIFSKNYVVKAVPI